MPAQRSSAARREVSVPTVRLGFSGGLHTSDLEAHRGQLTARVRHDSLTAPRVYTQSLPSARERGHTPMRRPPLAPTPLSSSASSFQAMTVGSSVSTATPSTPMALSPLLTSRLNGEATPAAPWVPPSAVAFAIPVAIPFSNSLSSPCLTAFHNENRTHQVPSCAVHRSRSFTPVDASALHTQHWQNATPRASPQTTVSWIPPPVAAHPSAARSPRVLVQRELSIPIHNAPLRDFCLHQHSFTPVEAWQAEHARAVSCTAAVRGPPITSFTPPLCIPTEPLATEAVLNNDADPETYALGTEVSIGSWRFRCTSVLGRGSFSEVWAGEVLGSISGQQVALKDIVCRTNTELQQAMLEVQLLERFRMQASAIGKVSPSMRIPQYFSHRVDKRADAWRVRLAMARVPGESLDSWYRRQAPSGQDGPSSVRMGCALAIALIRQLAPTLEQVAPYAFHRDINSHNVLVSDINGGRFDCSSDIEDLSRRASFWLIDFGLAVDAKTWPEKWTNSDVAGDCRYWPPSSFIMSFCGPEETRMKQDYCTQYKTKLDVVGLGLTALEMLCSTALSSRSSWGKDGLRGSWQRLFEAWERYREDVTRWHTMIFQVFTSGGDINPLYQQLGQERVVDRVIAHTVKVRECLKACIKRTEDRSIQSLLLVLSEMIDERSKFGFAEVLECLNSSLRIDATADAYVFALPPPPTRVPRGVAREFPTAPSEPVSLPVHRRQAAPCQRKSREDFHNDQRLHWLACGTHNSEGVQVKPAFGSTSAWKPYHCFAAGA